MKKKNIKPKKEHSYGPMRASTPYPLKRTPSMEACKARPTCLGNFFSFLKWTDNKSFAYFYFFKESRRCIIHSFFFSSHLK